MKKEKTKKEPKRKAKYGFFSCLGYSLKTTWDTKKIIAISSVAIIPIALISHAIGLYLPSIILSMLETEDNLLNIIFVIVAIFATQIIIHAVQHYMNIKRGNLEHFVLLNMMNKKDARIFDMDYGLSLEEENQKKLQRAAATVRNNHTAGIHFFENFANMIINILSFVLFGSVVSMLNPLILLILIAGCLINFYMAKWQQKRSRRRMDERELINKKLNYISWNVSRNLSYGKDVRLFSLADFFDNLIEKLENKWYKEQKNLEKTSFITSLVHLLIVLVRDGAAYAFLINQTVAGKVSSAEFVLYFSAITSLSGFISGVLNVWARMHEGALSVSDYREFFDIKDRLNRGKGIDAPKGRPLSIEFKNVSYKYPQGSEKIIDNVSFKIKAGEKIAIVGSNGAGKTTMTMLMCGLLVPDEGEVLIDGHSVYEYNRDELYSLFSLVPQKYSLMPLSIAENISIADTEAGEKIDYEKLNRCILTAGLDNKIKSLPMGADTPLNRQINPNATDLSGGEVQKLLLARAMYREAEILILDEPTAALDPIAEDRMYRQYNEIAKNTTSVFISHRLASTRFCDRVFFLHGAKIAEEGTHEELMTFDGKYKELFEVQAKYYKEDAAHE